jgi:hypothetical protein
MAPTRPDNESAKRPDSLGLSNVGRWAGRNPIRAVTLHLSDAVRKGKGAFWSAMAFSRRASFVTRQHFSDNNASPVPEPVSLWEHIGEQ